MKETRKAVKELREELKDKIPSSDTCPQCQGRSGTVSTMKFVDCKGCRGKGK